MATAHLTLYAENSYVVEVYDNSDKWIVRNNKCEIFLNSRKVAGKKRNIENETEKIF